MNNIINNYVRFFEDQLRATEMGYATYGQTQIRHLFDADKGFFGTVVAVNDKLGHIILKLRKNHIPRLKKTMTFCILRSSIWETFGRHLSEWTCLYFDFFETTEYHTMFSDIKPLYFMNSNDKEYDYIGCSSVSLPLFNAVCKALSQKRVIYFTMFESFPPTKYILNLKNYLLNNSNDENLFLKPKISYDDWNPHELSYTENIDKKIIESLKKDRLCILQGPPGTGKSYTIAQIVQYYLSIDKKVCVTTMSNKGLIELISQPPLKIALNEGKIRKTLLSADEKAHTPHLQLADKSLAVNAGELVCATNYVLSNKLNDINIETSTAFDLVVLEEASQLFLTTVAAFSKLGKQCLIVGDPMQLSPIVLNANNADYKDWDIDIQSRGLESFVLGSNIPSYRIITTFRLTPKSAELTGIFYNNSLKSVQQNRVSFSKLSSRFFPEEGGTLLHHLQGANDAICSSSAIELMQKIVRDIISTYPKYSVAIISPFKDTVKKLQRVFYHEGQTANIIVETIDSIQGITVDYVMFYLPLRNITFALEENRFNVATSRSRSTTLIISDMPLFGFCSVSKKVVQYLNQCQVVK